MTKSFEEYFKSKGSVGLFCVINPMGSRFGELLSALPVSKGTLNERLNEGASLGLVTKKFVKGERDTLELWVPTERGMEFYEELRARQIPPQFEAYRDAVQNFKQEKDAFVKYVERKDDADWERLEPTAYSREED
jgi:DNA-binding HxlR family transcriptional regulator